MRPLWATRGCAVALGLLSSQPPIPAPTQAAPSQLPRHALLDTEPPFKTISTGSDSRLRKSTRFEEFPFNILLGNDDLLSTR